MDTSMLNLALWIPFGIVLVIVSLIFLPSGYKRGLWRALLSLAATVVSTVLSVLLANWIAPMLSGAIVKALPPMQTQDMPLSESMMQDLVRGVIGMVLALVLFSVFLFVISIIVKSVCNYAASDKLKVENKGLKWAGLGVRMVDAVVFSLLLVLPLYGTLAAYAPAAQAVITLQPEEPEEAAYIDTVVTHPVVKASGTGPVAWTYNELSAIEVGGAKLDIAAMASSAEGLMSRVQAMSHASEEELLPMVQELISYAREEVIEQDWCYDLAMQAVDMLEQNIRQSVPAEEQKLVDELLEICDVSKAEFRENADELLAFAEYILENRLMDRELEELAADEAFLARVGELINSTEQAVALKNLLIVTALKAELSFVDEAQINRLTKDILSSEPTDKALRTQEAKAFAAIFAASGPFELVQALGLHPAVDTNMVEQLLPDIWQYMFYGA